MSLSNEKFVIIPIQSFFLNKKYVDFAPTDRLLGAQVWQEEKDSRFGV